jgi:hypothetical protein
MLNSCLYKLSFPVLYNIDTQLPNSSPHAPEIAVPLYVLRGRSTYSLHKTPNPPTNRHIDTRPKTLGVTQTVPPPPPAHMELRPIHQKSHKTNSFQPILFADQRENLISPKNIFVHLVTQFPVWLRVFPFSDDSPKSPNSKISIQFNSFDRQFSLFSWS